MASLVFHGSESEHFRTAPLHRHEQLWPFGIDQRSASPAVAPRLKSAGLSARRTVAERSSHGTGPLMRVLIRAPCHLARHWATRSIRFAYSRADPCSRPND